MMMNCFGEEWTDKKHEIFSLGIVVRISHHSKPPTCCQQDFTSILFNDVVQ